MPPAPSAGGPADPTAPSASHTPLHPYLVASSRTFLSPAAGAKAAEMEHSTPGHASGAEGHAVQGRYTCPMHPEISADQPGNCSICGMTLIKKISSGSKGEQP